MIPPKFCKKCGIIAGSKNFRKRKGLCGKCHAREIRAKNKVKAVKE